MAIADDLHVGISDLRQALDAAVPEPHIDRVIDLTPLLEALRQFAAVCHRYTVCRDFVAQRGNLIATMTGDGTAFFQAARNVTDVCGDWLWTADLEKPATAMTRPMVARADQDNRLVPGDSGHKLPAMAWRDDLMELLGALDYEIDKLDASDSKRVAMVTLRSEVERVHVDSEGLRCDELRTLWLSCHQQQEAAEWLGAGAWIGPVLVEKLSVALTAVRAAVENSDERREETPAAAVEATCHPAGTKPPVRFCDDNGHPIGPLRGSKTGLGFAIHQCKSPGDKSEQNFRKSLRRRASEGKVFVCDSSDSSQVEVFFVSHPAKNKAATRLAEFNEWRSTKPRETEDETTRN